LPVCVIALVVEVTSRYCIRTLGCFLPSCALKHCWGFLTVGFYSLDLMQFWFRGYTLIMSWRCFTT